MDNPEEDFKKSETLQYSWIKLFLIFLYSFGNLDLIKVGKVQTRLLAYPVFAFGPRTNPCHRIWLPFTVKLFPILTTSYPYQIIPNLSRASNLNVPNWPNSEFGLFLWPLHWFRYIRRFQLYSPIFWQRFLLRSVQCHIHYPLLPTRPPKPAYRRMFWAKRPPFRNSAQQMKFSASWTSELLQMPLDSLRMPACLPLYLTKRALATRLKNW